MGQWYGVARSNYVKVKDLAALKAAVENIDITVEEDEEGRVAFFGADSDSGGWPQTENEDGSELVPFNPAVTICPHIAEGEVLVCMEVGFERQRYVTGYASAYDHSGRVTYITLQDIYRKASEAFEVNMANITAAQY